MRETLANELGMISFFARSNEVVCAERGRLSGVKGEYSLCWCL